ncbi:hypothetical protein [Shewanella subflava]|uniref:Secreted protein n=1 Tax=Shewanella subflava TaxID=2986476 RepID=A0ABT3I9E3_9GAMM|nr:hypothetical protein [Shewanella subflava]MCW3172632.1 hypothetical protein [Shewanella subflava]
MKTILIILVCLFMTSNTYATPRFDIRNPNGSDKVRAADGSSCEQAVNSTTSFVMGIYGTDNDFNNYSYEQDWLLSRGNLSNGGDKGIYAGIQIQLGTPKRVDCNRLFDIEIARKNLELKQMEQQHLVEMQALRAELERVKNLGQIHFKQ